MPDTTTDNRPVIVTRDGADVSPILATEFDALHWLHQRVPYSADWAMRYEGYGERRLDVEPWDHAEQRNLRHGALDALRHDHPPVTSAAFAEWTHDGAADHVELVRDNCAACRLEGYNEGTDDGRVKLQPNHCAWARIYVQAGRPIPARYRAAFLDELNAREGDTLTPYAVALARDVATFGVRYTD